MVRLIRREPDATIELPAWGGLPATWHVFERDAIHAINAALVTGRPLLVRGEPGTGKSQLARAAAVELRRNLLTHVVDGRTETRDLLYTVDAIARLAEAQVQGAVQVRSDALVRKRIDVRRFVHPGPLWWAFSWSTARDQAKHAELAEPREPSWEVEQGCIVLVDEIDKADASVPNGLLEALGNGCFSAPGGVEVASDGGPPPLVIVTTNEERALPDAFLRRCLVLQLELPKKADDLVKVLAERGRVHFGEHIEGALFEEAAHKLAEDRAIVQADGLAAPGQAEYLDVLRAISRLYPGDADGQRAELEYLRTFAFRKHPRESWS